MKKSLDDKVVQKKRKLAQANIDKDQKLAQAKAQSRNDQQVITSNESSGVDGSMDTKVPPAIEDTKDWKMPADKDYFSFLSHKKKNSQLGSYMGYKIRL